MSQVLPGVRRDPASTLSPWTFPSSTSIFLPSRSPSVPPPTASRRGCWFSTAPPASVVAHTSVHALPDFFRRGDLIVLNDTKVFPARLLGRRDPSGGAVECLLVRRVDGDRWEALDAPRAEAAPGRARRVRGRGLRAPGRGARAALSRPPDRPPVERRRRRRRGRGRGRHRSRAAAALHPPAGRCGGPRAVPDGLRPGARIDCGADGRSAPDAGPARRASRRAASRGRTSRCTSATARSSRSGPSRWRTTAWTRSRSRSRPRRPPRSTARSTKGAAWCRSARRRRGRSRRRRRAADGVSAGRGDQRVVHPPRVPVPGARRAAHQLPPAEVVAADARVRVRRTRGGARGLRARRSRVATGSTATAMRC